MDLKCYGSTSPCRGESTSSTLVRFVKGINCRIAVVFGESDRLPTVGSIGSFFSVFVHSITFLTKPSLAAIIWKIGIKPVAN